MLIDLANVTHRRFYDEALYATIEWASVRPFRSSQITLMIECYISIYIKVERAYDTGNFDELPDVANLDTIAIEDFARDTYNIISKSAIPIALSVYGDIVAHFLVEFLSRRLAYCHGMTDDEQYIGAMNKEIRDGKHQYLFTHHYLSGRCDYELPQTPSA